MPKPQHVNFRVIDLHKKGYGPVAVKRILDTEGLNCTRQTASAIVKKYKQENVVRYGPFGNGGLRKLTLEMKDIIDQEMERNDELAAGDLVNILHERTGVDLGENTVRKARYELGWVRTGSKYCQAIRVVNQQKRYEFCHEMLATDEDFHDVIFTDEASVWIEGHKKVCFRRKWEPPKLKPKVKHPGKVHIWAGMSMRGATALLMFRENMNAEFYCETILRHGLIPYVEEHFPDGYRFMQDNDPKHTAARTRDFMLEHGIRWWPTPPESPDLNPIEMVWANLKHHLRKNVKPTIQAELRAGIRDYWSRVDAPMCQKYINHIHKVIPVVIEREGKASGH